MSKRKANGELAAAKATGKRKADAEDALDDQLDILLGDEVDQGALLPEADDLCDDNEDDALAEALGGGLDDDDDEEAYAESDAPGDDGEVGDLPDGLEEETLTEGEDVDLSAYELTLPQARRVAQSLARNESLSSLKMAEHTLAIADLREEDELEWDSEEYTDNDAIIIAELLKANAIVKRLDLARNQIGDAGACALAEMLSSNKTIEYLNLESNQFGERAGRAVIAAMGQNTSLSYLNMMYNSVPAGLQDELRETWQTSRQNQAVGLHL